jgi:hypothetical protein
MLSFTHTEGKSMPNPEIEQLIADALRNGIVHPGDPLKRIEPRPLRLPFKPSPGMPKEMTDLLEETTKQLAEAIVHLIEAEGGCELVPREELRALRCQHPTNGAQRPRPPAHRHRRFGDHTPVAQARIGAPAQQD